VVFAAVFAAPKLARLRGTWGIRIAAEGQRYADPKMGTLKGTVWQLRDAKERECCGEIASYLDLA
jgi:hypothetical protein